MKGIAFVIIYSIFLLALFGVMCYLMTIVNPELVKRPKDDKTTPEFPGNETHVFYTRDDDKDLSEVPGTLNLDLKSKRLNDNEFDFSKSNHVDKAANRDVHGGDLKVHNVSKGRRSVNSLKRNCKQNDKCLILNILDENNEPKIEIKLNVIPNETKRDEIYRSIHKFSKKTNNEIFEGILLKDFVVKILSNNTIAIDLSEKLAPEKNKTTASLNTNYNINEDIHNTTKMKQDNVIRLFENKNMFNDIELHVLTYLKADKEIISDKSNLTIEKFQNKYAIQFNDSIDSNGKNITEKIERINLINLTKDNNPNERTSHGGGFVDDNLNEYEAFNENLSTDDVTIRLSNENKMYKSDNLDNLPLKENLQLVKNFNKTTDNDNKKIDVRNDTTLNNFSIEVKQPNVLKEIKFIEEKSNENGKNGTIQIRKKLLSEKVIKDSKKINSTIEKLNMNKMPLYLQEKLNVTLVNNDLLKLNFSLVNSTNKNNNIIGSERLF